MGDFLLILFIIVISILSQKLTKNVKKPADHSVNATKTQRSQSQPAPSKKPAAPAKPLKAVPPTPMPKKPTAAHDTPHDEWTEGSIVMPPIEPHEHEGKPLPCPEIERRGERPRPIRVAQQQEDQQAKAPQEGLQLSFSRNALVQSVIMSEILSRPRFENNRRVIR